MNATETARICDAISQIKPAQRFDTETPAFWAVIPATFATRMPAKPS